mmetsp:Transcript_27248/g.70027  ORF Transcript_27248/g.70027 Transcript_27248/m.70027 type:complete len:278 (-) Transcript_27248:82-915(-)
MAAIRKPADTRTASDARGAASACWAGSPSACGRRRPAWHRWRLPGRARPPACGQRQPGGGAACGARARGAVAHGAVGGGGRGAGGGGERRWSQRQQRGCKGGAGSAAGQGGPLDPREDRVPDDQAPRAHRPCAQRLLCPLPGAARGDQAAGDKDGPAPGQRPRRAHLRRGRARARAGGGPLRAAALPGLRAGGARDARAGARQAAGRGAGAGRRVLRGGQAALLAPGVPAQQPALHLHEEPAPLAPLVVPPLTLQRGVTARRLLAWRANGPIAPNQT